MDGIIFHEVDTNEDVCYAGAECPGCGENRIDWLTWDEDEEVTCATCGAVYRPGEDNDTMVAPDGTIAPY